MTADGAPAASPQRPEEVVARRGAENHRLHDGPPDTLASLARLESMLGWLDRAQIELPRAQAPGADKAAEWLLDNAYVVAAAVRQVEHDLPRGYYRQLPALVPDEQGHLPRIYVLADDFIRSTHLEITVDGVARFVHAYQQVSTLELRELWALPIMLRLRCLEVLVQSCGRFAPQLRAPFETGAETPIPLFDDAECVARSIRGLRSVASISWAECVERTSPIEATLKTDPAGCYARMDLETRDRYRRAVEDLARRSEATELEVARLAVERARHGSDRTTHVGYWLIDEGREPIEESIGYRLPWTDRARRAVRARATLFYLGALCLLTAGFASVLGLYLARAGASWTTGIAAIVLAVVPASVLATTVLHDAIARGFSPTVLPKLDLREGILAEYRTAIVIPAMLGSTSEVDALLGQVERHLICSSDPSLRVVLLTDFPDAAVAERPEDAGLLERAAAGVERLNRKYGANGIRPFHLLHRERLYNESEGCWMGWERKRGKLDHLNRLIQDDGNAGFDFEVGDTVQLRAVRFVITLDADTVLPYGEAARLVGTLAHPLNRPSFDSGTGRVVAGYTVVQPRIETSPESARRSPFARIFCGEKAVDIYSRAASDAYQDLFAAGIYVGKGIYDVGAFVRSLAGRVPENAILSHDLFEGIHGRVALATDVVLYEDYPSTYLGFARRLARWVRGDWQLLPWLLRPGPFRPIDRWKIADNLRRSLFPASLLLLLIAGWTWLPGHPFVWTLLAVLVLAGPLLTELADRLIWQRRLSGRIRPTLRKHVARWISSLVFVPHEAAITVSSIVPTLVRVFITKRYLLLWTRAAHVEASMPPDRMRRLAWREMAIAPIVAGVVAVSLVFVRPSALPWAAPFLVAWFFSPELAAWLSRAHEPRRERLGPGQVAWLRKIARRTWLFFEVFVGPDDHWLPPDNYQRQFDVGVAHRTSPTNIGMMLLSTVVAYDLGYLGLSELALRIRNTLDTLDHLEKYRGHLFNWYDTRTLEPLAPRYVSSVDSGNLAGALITLERVCLQEGSETCLRSAPWQGLADSLSLLEESLEHFGRGAEASAAEPIAQTRKIRDQALAASRAPESGAGTIQRLCERDLPRLETLVRDSIHAAGPDPSLLHEVGVWVSRVRTQIDGTRHELDTLVPWLRVLEKAPVSAVGESASQILSEALAQLSEILSPSLSLDDASKRYALAETVISELRHRIGATNENGSDTVTAWIEELETNLEKASKNAERLAGELDRLGAHAERAMLAMDFRLLYDEQVRHLHIGYNVDADRLDPHHYDLMASEARLASFVGVVKGDLPPQHWFALERPLAKTRAGVALLSWGGSMFEYLMPSLLMRDYDGTLLAASAKAAVAQQIEDARQRGVPWGVSESGYSDVDANDNYRYLAFGSPALGRKRGLEKDVVVAPYATALALPLLPSSAVENLVRLSELGAVGPYGFYEAIDFTPRAGRASETPSIVRSYMSHHQGMFLAALDNLLCDGALLRRFEADTRVEAGQLLLQERVPDLFIPEAPAGVDPTVESKPSADELPQLEPWRPAEATTSRQIHALGNGRMGSWTSEHGSGGIGWCGHAISRWIPDRTLESTGLWVYIRDEESRAFWSATRQPTGIDEADTDVLFHAHMIEHHVRRHGLAVRMDVAVGSDADIEMRRLTVVNETNRHRRVSFTSYGEVVLAPARDDARHLSFSKLFVESEYRADLHALVFSRRPREPGRELPVLMHRLVADAETVRCTGFESDRERFIGRNGSLRTPRGLRVALSSTVGTTLDTAMALQAEVSLAPYATEQLAFVTIAAKSRSRLEQTATRFGTLASLESLLVDAHSSARQEIRELGLEPQRLPELQELLSSLLDPAGRLRGAAETIAANRLGQPELWGMGISGDHPILLVRTSDPNRDELFANVVRAHRLWRRRAIIVDLVAQLQIGSSYRDDALEGVQSLISSLGASQWLGQHGGIHLVREDQAQKPQLDLLAAAARVVIDQDGRSLRALLGPHVEPQPLPKLAPTRAAHSSEATKPVERPSNLLFTNGFGGFSPDGREYSTFLRPGQTTPAPWCNVLANDDFGCLVTEAGGGYSWAGNSGMFRLTPWTNDPVIDSPGESLYLRDEETAEVWTPTPRPAGRAFACEIRHGAGYTEWRQNACGFEQHMRVFVPPDDPVKVVALRLRNREARTRRVTATYYARWVLGRVADAGTAHVVPGYDPECAALVAHNAWNPDFKEHVAFLCSDRDPHGFTCDRTEFLGRAGDASSPAALGRLGLTGVARAGLDPCGALQVHLDIGPDAEVETTFILGAGRSRDHMRELARTWRRPQKVRRAWRQLHEHWDRRLDAMSVQTPDDAMNLMLNRWALYQALSSRILGRTGFYQSSGAFGFRDQLQDVLATIHIDSGIAKRHILESAAHQFEEGDVLHWWHPPAGRGIRTRCSDDLLWLPYVTARYVEGTGDLGILEEQVPFLTGAPLGPTEHQRFALFERGGGTGSLFEHCQRALERGVTRGPRGLPLIGDGDWNDGMNGVGSKGRGESVWLGWFAIETMTGFAGLCERMGERTQADMWRARSKELGAAIEREAWDGAWYRRAFDDDGRPWGSSRSEECKIDSIAQSWAVLCGAARPERAKSALRSAESELVRERDGLVRLLWPPFDETPREPGYIKAYPPGVRENGGQYTHAAVWLAWAFAQSGDAERAMRIARLINPIEHTRDSTDALRYRLEPYSVAADITAAEPHVGRGGWSWYTGSAAWYWRLGIEAILGLRRIDGKLRIDPCIPQTWPGFRATLRTEGGVLEVDVRNPDAAQRGVDTVVVDGRPMEGPSVDLPIDGKLHTVLVTLGTREG